jgi:hypothetical protein
MPPIGDCFSLQGQQDIHEALDRFQRELNRLFSPKSSSDVLDLDQIAALVHKRKSSMGTYKRRKQDPLPDADFPREGRGHRDHWSWTTIRPWLVRNFSLPIPEQFPEIYRRH